MSIRSFAVVTAALTFVLVLMGGLVHNTGSSLACPDWPLCFGQFFPKMEGGVLVEHSHRLVASGIGLLTAILAVLLWKRGAATGDRGLGRLGLFVLVLVLVQATFGGITVLKRLSPLVSTAHLGVSQLFLLTLVYIAFRVRAPGAPARPPLDAKVARMAGWALALVYVQVVIGASMRHLGAGLACTDLVLCQGQLFPRGAHPNTHLHMTHRLFALVVFGHLIGTAIVAVKRSRASEQARLVKWLALAAPVLAVTQITLGLLSIATFLDAVPVTAHLGVAAALLVDLLALYLVARGAPAAATLAAAPSTARREVAA